MFKMHHLLVIVLLLAWAGLLGLVAKVIKPLAPIVAWLFRRWELQFEAMTVHYMSSSAIQSQGTIVRYSATGSPPSWTTIPEVRTIGGPDGSANLIDVTDLSSTGKEYLVGLKDEGAVQLGLFYIPTNAVHGALRDAWSNRTQLQFQIQFADTGTTILEFTGYVQNFALTLGVDEPVTANVTLKITGSSIPTT